MKKNFIKKLLIFLLFFTLVFTVLTNLEVINKIEIRSQLNNLENYINPQSSKGELNSYSPINRNNYPFVLDFDKIDWVDYAFVAYEANRTGPGEQGKPFILTDPEDIKKNEEIEKIEGLNAVISDKISVNRSVPDTRPDKCKGKTYLKVLPSVSIIMIFHNEYQSILYRSLHSVYNRTPHKLLHEIILVNDKSTRDYLYEPLEKYIEENFHGKVKIIVLPERSGLIRARMEGAKVATGEILVFMDAHVEANVNWLPPLIEPIAIDPLTSTTPVIDNFRRQTFEYQKGAPNRGIFDWEFMYHWIRLNPKSVPEQNFESPLMLGCVFAINRQYYWDLGAYDEELMIWNGENYELSFKLWLCGGRLLQIPCSRVAHTFRVHNEYRKKEGVDFVGRNFKRIAETWLDEYKELLYKTNVKRFKKIDPGDLTKPNMIKKQLKCKPFKYFLEYVAPEILEMFPITPHQNFASGAIISDANPNVCIDDLQFPSDHQLALFNCHSDRKNPDYSQYFKLTYFRNIMHEHLCLDADNINLIDCHFYLNGNQFWRYDLETHHLVTGNSCGKSCLTANLYESSLSLSNCDADNVNQKWSWGFVNETLLKDWFGYGSELSDNC